MRFEKWQACGNDFLLVERDLKPFSVHAVKLCDRHYGVGADGILRIDPSEEADCKMTIINANGSEAEMCGNGIRCVGQYMSEKLNKPVISVETKAGIKEVEIVEAYNKVRVNMGKAEIKWAKEIELPESVNAKTKSEKKRIYKDAFYVDIGNPHCVLLVKEEDTQYGAVERFGRRISQLKSHFPEGANVEFVTLLGGNEIRVKVWERGVGRTLACGTGACASAYVAYQQGLTDLESKSVRVKLDGGLVEVKMTEEGIQMTGPAKRICSGEYQKEKVEDPSEEKK